MSDDTILQVLHGQKEIETQPALLYRVQEASSHLWWRKEELWEFKMDYATWRGDYDALIGGALAAGIKFVVVAPAGMVEKIKKDLNMSNKAKLRLELVLQQCETKMKSVNLECVLHIRCSAVDGTFRAFHVGPYLNNQYVGDTLEEALRNMAAGERSEKCL